VDAKTKKTPMTDNNLRDRREDEPVYARKKQVVDCNKSGKSVYAMNKVELLDLFKCEVEEVTKGEFVLIRELYVDRYGETYVYHGLDTERNKPIVIKVLLDSPGADMMEYIIHRLLHLPGFKTHPNILSLHAESDENTIEHPFVFVFLEKMEMSLEDYLKNKRDTVTSYPGNAIVQMADIQKGLRYMHDRHVAHLDIKTANILLRFANGDYMSPVPKISDFGLSQLMLSNNTFEHPKLVFEMDPYTGQRYVLGQLVTAHYRPIELKVRYSAFNAGKYDEFVERGCSFFQHYVYVGDERQCIPKPIYRLLLGRTRRKFICTDC
jgi:serine/threonine protein kinase